MYDGAAAVAIIVFDVVLRIVLFLLSFAVWNQKINIAIKYLKIKLCTTNGNASNSLHTHTHTKVVSAACVYVYCFSFSLCAHLPLSNPAVLRLHHPHTLTIQN